jgi:hypothetical protein
MKASTSRPDIVAEIRGRYDKMDSTIFIVENSDNQIFALNPRRI